MSANDTIGNMTQQELERFIEKVVERSKLVYPRPKDDRTMAEILAAIDEHRWTPPAGSKSTLELIREDRDA